MVVYNTLKIVTTVVDVIFAVACLAYITSNEANDPELRRADFNMAMVLIANLLAIWWIR